MEQDSKVCRGSPGERTCTEHPCKSGVWMRRTEVCGAVAVCVALCLLSLGVCVLVYLRTTELQARVNSLEKHGEPQHSAWMFLEQVEPVLLNRLDQMLEEVSACLRLLKSGYGKCMMNYQVPGNVLQVCCVQDIFLVWC